MKLGSKGLPFKFKCFVLFWLLLGVHSTSSAVIDNSILNPALSLDIATGDADTTDQYDGIIENIKYSYNNSINGNSTGLAKRLNVEVCGLYLHVGDTIIAFAGLVTAWVVASRSASKTIVNESHDKNCGVVSHDANQGGVVMRYIYSASGRDCDTTAQKETIDGALDKAYNQYIHLHPKHVWCLDSTHGGNWKGYLLIGPKDAFPSSISCGAVNIGTCVSGGKNDIHHRDLDGEVYFNSTNGYDIEYSESGFTAIYTGLD